MRGTCGLRDLTRCSDHDGSLRAADNCATSAAVQQLHIAKHVTNDRKVLGFPALSLSIRPPHSPRFLEKALQAPQSTGPTLMRRNGFLSFPFRACLILPQTNLFRFVFTVYFGSKNNPSTPKANQFTSVFANDNLDFDLWLS